MNREDLSPSKQNPVVKIKEVGAASIISALYRELGIMKIINNNVTWDEKQWLLNPGERVLALIISTLHGRSPLYRVNEFFEEKDLALLFRPGVTIDNLNDDALGGVLDRIYEAGPRKLFSAVALQVQLREQIGIGVLHFDTTARLVYGDYDQENGIFITRGYNKEHRNLKQFKIGIAANKDGFPFFADVMDGNLDDKTWNKEVIEKIGDSLQNIVYVADSALATETNLDLIAEKGFRFISRLPATFAKEDQLIEKAFALNQWEDLGKICPGKNRASYKVQEFRETLYGREYRFVVVKSSHLNKGQAKKVLMRAQKEKILLDKAAKKLQGLNFACEPDAQNALQRFLEEKKGVFHPLSGTVESYREKVKRNGRGRPSKEEPVQYSHFYRINPEIGELDEDAVNREKERLSCFVLISNVAQDYCTRDVLREYKEQTTVENRFKFIKHPLYAGPMYLHKNERLEALSYVILIALIIYIVMQRRVRLALENESEPLVITGKKKTFTPTGNKILELLRSVKILNFCKDGAVERYLPENYNKLARVVRFLGFDMDVFVRLRSP